MQLQFSTTLASGDGKRHIPHTFTVPAACSRLTIRLHYAPRLGDGISNLLTLTLFDPDGFRGAGHRGGDTQVVELTPTTATQRSGVCVASFQARTATPCLPASTCKTLRPP